MKVSELWLREIVNPPVTTQTWLEQFTQVGIEVDSVDTLVDSQDTIATLKLPPNRGDCLSMEGLAREWAVINDISFCPIDFKIVLPNINDSFPLSITASEVCPRYCGRILQNVNVNVETPSFIKERLEKAGIRSLSPIVDVTNYVMLELGQPMHAFDLAQIDSEIIVRMAKPLETIITLEGKKVVLSENTLVIADKNKPLAIAGIIGGEHSGVNENTKNIFLESAYFNPIQIRQTANRFKLRTESSQRFERGIDYALQTRALERATHLLTQIVGGNVGPIIEYSSIEHLPNPPALTLRANRIEKILGISSKEIDVEAILSRLGMKVTPSTQKSQKNLIPSEREWSIAVPTFRSDLQLEIDLIEELARIHGYQNIPEIMPTLTLEADLIPESVLSLSTIKNILISRGYREVITYSFISPEFNQFLQQEHPPLSLSNPISEDMSIMRESLIPGLLQVLKYNQDRQILRIRCFETGTAFNWEAEEWQEISSIAGLSSNTLLPEQWGTKNEPLDFYDVKNDIEALLGKRLQDTALDGVNEFITFKPMTHPLCHPTQTAEIVLDKKRLGFIGTLHPAVLKALDCQGPVVIFELSLKEVQKEKKLRFREVSKYPAIRRDIAIIVDEKMLAQELISAIVKCVGPLLRDVWVFDVYQGKGIEMGKKSLGFGLLLQHSSRTLVEEEVNTLMKKVIQLLSEQYHAILRE